LRGFDSRFDSNEKNDSQVPRDMMQRADSTWIIDSDMKGIPITLPIRGVMTSVLH